MTVVYKGRDRGLYNLTLTVIDMSSFQFHIWSEVKLPPDEQVPCMVGRERREDCEDWASTGWYHSAGDFVCSTCGSKVGLTHPVKE